MTTDYPELQPSLLGALWRYRSLAILLAVVGGLGALLLGGRDPQFEATANVAFQDPSQPIAGAVSLDLLDRYVLTQAQILESAATAEIASEIAQEEGIDLSPGQLFVGSDIVNVPETNIVIVVMRAHSEEAATVGANSLIEAYRRVRQQQIEEEASAVLNRLEAAIDEVENNLAAVGAQIELLPVGSVTLADLEQQVELLSDQIVSVQQSNGGVEILRDLRERSSTLQEVIALAKTRPDAVALVRDQEELLERRADLVSRRNEVELGAETSASGISFVEPAHGTSAPGPPAGRFLTLLGGALLGLMLGVGIAYYLAVLRRRFTQRGEPEVVLGVPLLAEIPDFSEEHLETDIPVRDHPRSASAEAFRFVAANIDMSAAVDGERLVAVVSATVGEGKSIVTANTAMAAAASGRKVLVIDADFGNQAISEMLTGSLGSGPGLTEAVEGLIPLENLVTKASGPISGVHVLPRGLGPAIASDFFSSASADAFFRNARRSFDLVLVDCPPLLQVAYASTLVRLSDVVLVVVSYDGRVRLVEEVARKLRMIGTKSIGYVFNRAPLRRDMVMTEGSMKDVIGERRQPVSNPEAS